MYLKDIDKYFVLYYSIKDRKGGGLCFLEEVEKKKILVYQKKT